MRDIKLCPVLGNQELLQRHGSGDVAPYIRANECSEDAVKRRDEALEEFIKKRGPLCPDVPFQTAFQPLEECIFTIKWEAMDCPQMQKILGTETLMPEEFFLLRSAAQYQAKYEDVGDIFLNCHKEERLT